MKPSSEPHFSASTSETFPVCLWDLDFLDGRVSCSEDLCHLLDRSFDELPNAVRDLGQLAHAQGKVQIETMLRQLGEGRIYNDSLTLISASGKLLDMNATGFPVSDRSGIACGGLVFGRLRHPAALRVSQNRSREILLAQAERIADFGTWEFHLKSQIGSVSPRLAIMLGFGPGTRLGGNAYWERVHVDDRSAVREIWDEAIRLLQPFQYTARYVLPGGIMRHHLVKGIPVVAPGGAVERFVGITQDFSSETHVEKELHRLSQQLLRARDEERRNVARELHESTGQTLAALKMSLGRLREALPEDDSSLQDLLKAAVDLADDAVREVRTLSYLMHPPMLDEAGLGSALRWYAKGFAERSGIAIIVDIAPDLGRHGRELETTVFRIVQEALTNVHRYSGSKTATIRLQVENDSLRAEVCDEGSGLPVLTSAADHGAALGVGIAGMRERVNLLNGVFDIESSPGKGTTVRVVLPLVRRS